VNIKWYGHSAFRLTTAGDVSIIIDPYEPGGLGGTITYNPKDLKAIFEHHVFRMLLGKGKITQDLVLLLRSWRHSGFQVFVGPRILPGEEEAMEKLARYIIRASFSQERMTYLPEESKVIYQSKDAQKEKVFDALE